MLNAFLHAQEISETFVLFTSDPWEVITKVELQERWEPYLSEAFIRYNGVYDLITHERKIAAAVGAASLLTSVTHGKTEMAIPGGNLSLPTLRLLSATGTILWLSCYYSPNFTEMVTRHPTLPVQPR